MALGIAKRSVRGSLVLVISGLTATLVNVVTLILVARMLGPSGYGAYALALVIPGLLQLFLGFGVSAAVIRYAAYYNASGREAEAKRFTLNAILFLGLTGAVLTALCFVFAGSLSALILHRPSFAPYIQLASLSVLGNAAVQTATTAAIGWNWMTLSGSTTAFQAIVKLGLSPALILLGFGVTGALVGHIASLFVAGTAGVCILYYRRLRGSGNLGEFLSDVKEMNAYGIPVYVGGLVLGLASYYVLILLAAIASNTVYGYYQAAANFTSPITLVASSMVSSLFPAFASIDGIKADVSSAFRHAYKFVAFLLTPFVMFIIASAGPLVRIIYGTAYAGSVPYLQLLCFAYLPIAFGYSVHPAFFNGFGRTRLTFVLYLTAAVTLVIAAPFLALTLGLGVDGLILATLLSFLVAWAVGTLLAFRFMHAALDARSTGTILFVSAVAFIVTTLLPPTGSALATLVLNTVLFFGIYITLTPLTRAITKNDLDLLELTFREPAFVAKIASPVIRYERYLLDLGRKRAGPP